jgi:hypothetical protein
MIDFIGSPEPLSTRARRPAVRRRIRDRPDLAVLKGFDAY